MQEIGETSTKLITFIDLAGHHKYLKTTISALTGQCSHSGSFYVIYCGIFKLMLPRAHVLRVYYGSPSFLYVLTIKDMGSVRIRVQYRYQYPDCKYD